MEWNHQTNRLEMACKVFSDDLIRGVQNENQDSLYWGTDKQVPNAQQKIYDYFTNHIRITINDSINIPLTCIGMEDEIKVYWFYIESDQLPENTQSIHVENTLFYDVLPDQKNYIHFTNNGVKESFILNKSKSSTEILSLNK